MATLNLLRLAYYSKLLVRLLGLLTDYFLCLAVIIGLDLEIN